MAKKENKGTYFTLAKWFKWSSLIIMLVPIAVMIMAIINGVQTNWDSSRLGWYEKGAEIIGIISLVVAIIWIILNIIMFFAAGTVRGQARPGLIRFWLLLALALVLAPIIIGLVAVYVESFATWGGAGWLITFLPLITISGYVIGSIAGSKIQAALE